MGVVCHIASYFGSFVAGFFFWLHCNLESFSFILMRFPMNISTFRMAQIVLASLTLITACGPQSASAPPEVIRPVKAVVVGGASAVPSATYSAEIRPRIESQLAFRVGGKVVERLVELGATVRKGQVLMRLDPADLQLSANAALAQVAAAKANDDVAQAALKRSQELARQNFISSGALEVATGQAAVTHAALTAAQANSALGINATQYGILKADADGVVTALSAEVGQIVAAGTPVLKVSAGTQKDVVFSVPEGALGVLKRGALLGVQLWSNAGTTLPATVRDISAIADPLTRTFTIKAALSDASNAALLGSTATVVVTAQAASKAVGAIQQAIVIPLASVVETQGKTAVWVVETSNNVSVAKKRAVTLAPTLPASGADAQVMVASGLAQGQVVVTAGVHTLTDGQKVRVLDAAKP
jgi:RND family efflux transporter MFP subunit